MISKLQDNISIAIALLLVILPLVAVLIAGLNYRLIIVLQEKELWSAIATSLIIAISSGCLSLSIAGLFLMASFYLKFSKVSNKLADSLLMFSKINLLVSPFIVAILVFLLFHNIFGFNNVTFCIIIITNSLMSLPFIVGILQPVVMFTQKEEWWLCQNLNIKGKEYFWLILWPKLRVATSFAFSIAIILSWGDLSVIALFGSHDLTTLPILLYLKMENYRMHDSSVVALIMLILSIVIYRIVERAFMVKNVSNR